MAEMVLPTSNWSFAGPNNETSRIYYRYISMP